MTRDEEIQREVQKLRGASDSQLMAYCRQSGARRVEWFQTRHGNRISASSDPLERAYRVLLQKLGIRETDAPIATKDRTRLVFHSRNFCPTLEACKLLGLDTRRVCRLYNEGAAQDLVQQIDDRLAFRRSYERLRPYSDYCEEIIEYSSGSA